MAVQFENHVANDDWTTIGDAVTRLGQPFVVASKHSVSSIKLKAYRAGSPGVLTVAVYATSGGNPTGAALTSGTLNVNSITETNTGEVITINMTEYMLTPATYCIVAYGAGCGGANSIAWRGKATSGYTPTNIKSTNSGSTWAANGQPDAFYFEVYGTPVISESEVLGTSVESTSFGFLMSESEIAGEPTEAVKAKFGFSNQAKSSASWTNQEKH